MSGVCTQSLLLLPTYCQYWWYRVFLSLSFSLSNNSFSLHLCIAFCRTTYCIVLAHVMPFASLFHTLPYSCTHFHPIQYNIYSENSILYCPLYWQCMRSLRFWFRIRSNRESCPPILAPFSLNSVANSVKSQILIIIYEQKIKIYYLQCGSRVYKFTLIPPDKILNFKA